MRYRLYEHSAFPGLLSKEDLFLLVERGSLARGDLCTDTHTGRDHTVGAIIGGMRAPNSRSAPRVDRPLYREFRADAQEETPPQIPRRGIPSTDLEGDEEDDDHELKATPPQPASRQRSFPGPGRVTSSAALDDPKHTAGVPDGESEEEDADTEPDETDDAVNEDGTEANPVEKNAEAGETVLFQAHPSWLGSGKLLFLIFLLLATTGMLIPIEPEFALVTLLLSIGLFILASIGRLTRDYVVTDERVEVVWGLIGRSSKEVRICDIRNMDVHERGLKGMLGLGTVDFSSAANSGIEVQFRDIRRAHEVKELVRELQRESLRRDY